MKVKFSKIVSTVILLSVTSISSVNAAVDNCMVGKWKPEPAQLKKQFEQMSRQQIGNISGQVTLNFNKNGSGIYQMNNFTLSMKPATGGPPMQVTMVMNGSSNFNWSAANKTFSMKNHKVALKTSGWMEMGGTKIPLPSMPIDNNKAAVGVADGAYTCTGNKLVFQPKEKGTVLKVWYRI